MQRNELNAEKWRRQGEISKELESLIRKLTTQGPPAGSRGPINWGPRSLCGTSLSSLIFDFRVEELEGSNDCVNQRRPHQFRLFGKCSFLK